MLKMILILTAAAEVEKARVAAEETKLRVAYINILENF
jgi:hypothetical protein